MALQWNHDGPSTLPPQASTGAHALSPLIYEAGSISRASSCGLGALENVDSEAKASDEEKEGTWASEYARFSPGIPGSDESLIRDLFSFQYRAETVVLPEDPVFGRASTPALYATPASTRVGTLSSVSQDRRSDGHGDKSSSSMACKRRREEEEESVLSFVSPKRRRENEDELDVEKAHESEAAGPSNSCVLQDPPSDAPGHELPSSLPCKRRREEEDESGPEKADDSEAGPSTQKRLRHSLGSHKCDEERTPSGGGQGHTADGSSKSRMSTPPSKYGGRETGAELHLEGRSVKQDEALEAGPSGQATPTRTPPSGCGGNETGAEQEQEQVQAEGSTKPDEAPEAGPSKRATGTSTPPSKYDGSEGEGNADGDKEYRQPIRRRRVKTTDESLTCSQCGTTFGRLTDLVRHRETVHERDDRRPKWQCPRCSLVVSRKDALTRHIRSRVCRRK